MLSSDRRASTDFLIADMQMPDMTGLELRFKLGCAGKQIPTILITGYPNERARLQALKAGVLLYLAKPFGDDNMLCCIRLAVEQRNSDGRLT
jgi:FixJ family two-component response regulator